MENLLQEFNTKRPFYEFLCEEALFIINKALLQLDIKMNKIESRIKKV